MTKRTCAIDGCDRDSRSRGMCSMHYSSWRKAQGPDWTPPPRQRKSCSIDGCDKPHRGDGYCQNHLHNFRKTGNPIPKYDWPLIDRLRDVGWTVTESGCWEWNGPRNPDGYGLITARRLGYIAYGVHRAMYEHSVGPIPEGQIIRHHCDNPPCCNPDHLIPGSLQDNVRDMIERRRHRDHGRTACSKGHDLTLPGALRQVTRKRDGYIYSVCVECYRALHRETERRRREAAKAARAASNVA